MPGSCESGADFVNFDKFLTKIRAVAPDFGSLAAGRGRGWGIFRPNERPGIGTPLG